jgi:hypothetical protein
MSLQPIPFEFSPKFQQCAKPENCDGCVQIVEKLFCNDLAGKKVCFL